MAMAPAPENIKFQAASNIELVPIGTILAIDGTGTIFTLSNVDSFAATPSDNLIVYPDSGPRSIIAGSNLVSVDASAKTLTFTTAPVEVLAVNDVQTLTQSATSGSFSLRWNGYATPSIAWNASAATIQAALRALPNAPSAAFVVCTGGPLNTTPVVATFSGAGVAGALQSDIVPLNTLLVGGTLAVAHTTPGVAYSAPVSVGSILVAPSLIDLGGTNGGITVAAKPEVVNVEYDQVEGDVENFRVHWNVDLSFELEEQVVQQWAYLAQMGYITRAAAVGVPGASILKLAGGRTYKYGARFTIPKQDESVTTLNDYYLAFRVASISGIETVFRKREATRLPVSFHTLADPRRPRGDRFGRFIQETSAAL